MMKMLTLVGAGPGDPELISVKGLRCIERADVILYDALVSKDLLKHSKRGCKLIYVGKRKGKKEFSQDEINKLLVFYAHRFNNVLRLKGGDPNVFGRGHEEATYAEKFGVHVEIVPGISSALAAPNAAGIPLTKRGVTESFWVVTGTTSTHEISEDILLAAKSSATVVILMGISHLAEIADIFYNLRSPSEPIAVVQKATLPGQKIVIGTAADIAKKTQTENITSPGIIIIGKVVKESKLVSDFIQEGLSEIITSTQNV